MTTDADFSSHGLGVSFQRIGRGSWSARGILRSWAVAPWRVVSGGVAVACFPDEAIWLGLSREGEPVAVRLASRGGKWFRELTVPPDWQLGWLASGNETRPIALARGCRSATYRLKVTRAGKAVPEQLTLTLLTPAAWEEYFGALDLTPAVEPPLVGLYCQAIPPLD